MKKQTILIIISIIILAILAGGLWYFINQKNNNLNNKNNQTPIQKEEQIATTTNPENEQTATSSEEIDTSNWKTYRNEEWGFKVDYPSNFETISNQWNYHHFYDDFHNPLYRIRFIYSNKDKSQIHTSSDDGISISIIDDPRSLPATESQKADFLNAYVKKSGLTAEKLSFKNSDSYRIADNNKNYSYLTFFEFDRLIYIIELYINDNESDLEYDYLTSYNKIVDSFALITQKSLPDINISLENYNTGLKQENDQIYCPPLTVVTEYYNFCDIGLKCLGIKFCQDGAYLVSVDYSSRYDFLNYDVISEKNKNLFNSNIVQAINDNKIYGYEKENLVYFKKGDYVYIIRIDWFTDYNNKDILKTFNID